MAEFVRAYSVVYGSLTIGGANTEIKLDGPVMIREENDSATISCTAVLRPGTDTDAALATLMASTVAAMRIPRLLLTIHTGSTSRAWSPATGTKTSGNCKPAITEPTDRVVDSRRSRRVNFSWNLDLNATPYGTDGRRDANKTDTRTGADQGTVTISGEYRADSSYPSARDRYNASIDAYVALVLAELSFTGKTYELIGVPSVTTDDTDFICHFSRTYQEIIRDQALGTRNYAPIVNPQLQITRTSEHPGDSPGKTVSRVITLSAQYSCEVNKATTDLYGLWKNTIEPLILERAQTIFGATVAAITSRSVTPDYYKNGLSGSIQMLATTGGNVLSYTSSVTTTDDPGEVEEPIGTGGPYDRFVHDGPASYTIQVTETTRTLGNSGGSSVKKASKPPSSASSGGGISFNPGKTDDSGQAFTSTGLQYQVPQPSKSAKGSGGAGGPGQGEWSKPVTTTTTQATNIGEAPYQMAVTDTTVVTMRRWRNPYQPGKGGGVTLTSGGKAVLQGG